MTQVTDKGIGLTKLHVVIESAVKFLRGGGRLIVVDCLETLILYNDFTAIFRFLTALKDHAVETKSAVLVVVDKETLKERELNVLLREFIPVRNLKSLLKTSA